MDLSFTDLEEMERELLRESALIYAFSDSRRGARPTCSSSYRVLLSPSGSLTQSSQKTPKDQKETKVYT